jgi:hypothetical protein
VLQVSQRNKSSKRSRSPEPQAATSKFLRANQTGAIHVFCLFRRRSGISELPRILRANGAARNIRSSEGREFASWRIVARICSVRGFADVVYCGWPRAGGTKPVIAFRGGVTMRAESALGVDDNETAA